jgi:N-acylglucosamine-6-phosphate 2-epimerase
MTSSTSLSTLRGGLVVSCQAPSDDPLSGPDVMARVAASVVAGGAVGIRAEGIDDLRAIRAAVTVPVIGLLKDFAADVYITPTVRHAAEVAATGVDLVAADGTARSRPDGSSLPQLIAAVHARGTGFLADIATGDEGAAAEQAGADAVATTLSGYTTDVDGAPPGPDLVLVERLASRLAVPVLAEGRYSDPADVRRALDAGAWAVVVGTAITRPQVIAARFARVADAARSRS